MVIDTELEGFKTTINLTEYAASQGYVLDRKESSQHSIVMRGDDENKIIVARGQDRHWIYFSVHDDTDHGSIIDFVQNRQHLTLGRVRQELRPWMGESSARSHINPTFFAPSVTAVSKDRLTVIKAYGHMKAAGCHPYLIDERHIPVAVLKNPRFSNKIRKDDYKNAIFPHYAGEGLCGYEIKNHDFTGFSSGGSKGLWVSACNKEDCRLVITESGIDALSYYALYPQRQTRYASIGGSMNHDQPELIKRAVARLKIGSEVVLAFDADASGRNLADQIQTLIEAIDRDDLTIIRAEPPEEGRDWNDMLKVSTISGHSR